MLKNLSYLRQSAELAQTYREKSQSPNIAKKLQISRTFFATIQHSGQIEIVYMNVNLLKNSPPKTRFYNQLLSSIH